MRFEFENTPSEEFGVSSYTYGDVVNGVVVMDSDSGAFSVTWNVAGEGSLGPIQFTLHMINRSPGVENVVSTSETWIGGSVSEPKIFSFYDPGIMLWQKDQEISTYGTFNNVDYISSAFSIFTNNKDLVEATGTLKIDSEPISDLDEDSVEDSSDLWNESDTRETVYLLGINTWISNKVNGSLVTEDGFTLADIIQLLELAASEDAKNHGQYVQELVRSYKMLVKDDVITQKEHTSLIRIIVKHGK